ncbi:MAG: hypothetical protein PVG50_02850 [Thiohalophilus sp.]|jgi:hypothetical protein
MKTVLSLIMMVMMTGHAWAAEQAPWGSAEVLNIEYPPQKVVYDVSVSSQAQLSRVLDRASYLSKVYHADSFDASIVLVLHGNEIPLFAIENYTKNKELMQRAYSLTLDNVIEFRMCKIAARGHGYEPKEIHGFVKMVPMADAEIIRLQREEHYAYMQ